MDDPRRCAVAAPTRVCELGLAKYHRPLKRIHGRGARHSVVVRQGRNIQWLHFNRDQRSELKIRLRSQPMMPEISRIAATISRGRRQTIGSKEGAAGPLFPTPPYSGGCNSLLSQPITRSSAGRSRNTGTCAFLSRREVAPKPEVPRTRDMSVVQRGPSCNAAAGPQFRQFKTR
jgi:hypothetical protein